MMWWMVVVLSTVVQSGAAQWWGSAVYYRVVVDSFKDIDGDGLGDIKGLIKQLSYVKALEADAVILSPISARSPDCTTPGVIDFTELDQRFGNLDAFNDLLEKAKKLELKLVITLPLQTVSAASEWFNSSVGRVTGFEDRILWKEGSPDNPPMPIALDLQNRLHVFWNKTKDHVQELPLPGHQRLVSHFTQRNIEKGDFLYPQAEDEITWTWNEGRGAFYATKNNETLLNLCSDAVAAALASAQCAWLRRGVAGVLLYPDFPINEECGEKLLKKMVSEAVICARADSLETPVILVESSLSPEAAARYYADGAMGATSVISNAMTSPTRGSAAGLALAFYAALLNAPQDTVPTWMTSIHDKSRITSRYGTDMVDAINLLTLMLPGAAIIHQGDELGAADTILEWASSGCWPNPATPSYAPFPWDDTTNGGFSTGEPWLPLTPNYRYANAKTEFANDISHVGVVRIAGAMRKSPAMGPHAEIKRLNEAVAVLRWGNTGSLLAVANLATTPTDVELARIPGIPPEMTVAASPAGSSLAIGSHVATEKTLRLTSGETVLLAGPPRHCGGPGPVDKIASKLNEGWQKLNKYFST